jgi:L-asparaginase II
MPTGRAAPNRRDGAAISLRIEVALQRGPILESIHRFEAAAVDVDGIATARSVRPDRVTTFRSAAKPFQLVPLIEAGHADRFAFTPEDLAVMASSHTGSAAHVALVAGILERIGCTDRDLRCGYHEPLDPSSRERLARQPASRSPLYNNCSGKHAGMLALAAAEGWPLDSYESPDHPLQRRMRDVIASMCDLDPERMPVAVDGCSVSVFGVPLERMALAYARLATASDAGDGRQRALARVRRAMQAFPLAAGGAERFSTALMEATGGRLVAKGGAEGLECVALTETSLGVAVKCLDGADRAVPPAMIALLEHLGALSSGERDALEVWRRRTVTNHNGLEVGFLEASVREESSA